MSKADRQDCRSKKTTNEHSTLQTWCVMVVLGVGHDEFHARKREIETLSVELARLRARVDQLETQQIQQAEQSALKDAQLQARLSASRQQVISLRNSLDEVYADG